MAQTNVQAFSGDVAISSNLAVDTNTLFVDSVGNRVGIGVTDPDAKLHVNGNAIIGDVGVVSGLTHQDAQLILGGSYNQGYNIDDKIKLLITSGDNDGGSPYYIMCQDENDHDQFFLKGGNTSSGTGGIMYFKGNVGIGKTNPGSALDVVGDVAISSNLAVDTNTLFVDSVGNKVGIGVTSPVQALTINGHTLSYGSPGGQYQGLRVTNENVNYGSSAGIGMYVASAVNAVPNASVSGTLMGNIDTYLANGTDAYMRFFVSPFNSTTAGDAKMVIKNNGNVGIGTTNPQGQLHISSGTSGDCVLILQADTDNNNESDNPRIEFRQDGALIESVIAQGNNDLQLKNGIEGITFWTGGTEVGGDHVINTIQRMFINNDGNVGIGTASPVGKLHIVHGADGGATKDLDDQTNCAITSQRDDGDNRWMHGINGTNDYLFWYDADGSGIATCKAFFDENGSNSVDQNFTGQHRTFIKDVPFSQAGDLEGLVVSADQNKYIKMSGGIEAGSNAITTNESLPVVSLSTTTNDKKCFGVISVSEDPETRQNRLGNVVSVSQKEKGDTRVFINSVGEGAIWVTNINGSLESGDYITTSNVAGYGQKQDSEFLANYTVAKITMDCDFEPVTQPIQQIKKELEDVNYWVKTTYENVSEEEYSNLADESRRIVDDIYQEINKEESKTEQEGYELEVRQELVNVLDEHGQIQWEDDPSGATEKAYKIRYLDADGVETDEANAVHKAAFVGCTYHCG